MAERPPAERREPRVAREQKRTAAAAGSTFGAGVLEPSAPPVAASRPPEPTPEPTPEPSSEARQEQESGKPRQRREDRGGAQEVPGFGAGL